VWCLGISQKHASRQAWQHRGSEHAASRQACDAGAHLGHNVTLYVTWAYSVPDLSVCMRSLASYRRSEHALTVQRSKVCEHTLTQAMSVRTHWGAGNRPSDQGGGEGEVAVGPTRWLRTDMDIRHFFSARRKKFLYKRDNDLREYRKYGKDGGAWWAVRGGWGIV
jgi:hypothetical protein